MKDHYDVAVIGGGPIGGHIAKFFSDAGAQVALFEEHKEIGIPLKCAGLVTSKVFDFINFSEQNVTVNRIKGAHIHSPLGNVLTIGGDRVHALVIDRVKFDKKIIKTAKDNGTELFLGIKVTSFQKKKQNINLTTSQDSQVACNLVIGADGPYSKTRDIFKLSQPTEMLKGIGAEITNTELDPDFVEIFIGNDIAPGFFAWIIPTNEQGTTARVGLCIRPDAPYPPKHYFSNLFAYKRTSFFLKGSYILQKTGGVVPIGALKKTYAPNMMLVGDAAAQVKPSSGGGIYTGLLCANHCVSVGLDALEKNDFSQNFLRQYHKLWTSDIGRELYLGMKFRSIFKRLSDKQLDKYIQKFQDPKITNIISEYGDIDYPSKLVKPLIKNVPSLLKLIPTIIKE